MVHTSECRARFLDKFMSTSKGRARLEAYEERVDRAIAERNNVLRPTATDDVPQPRPDERDDRATPSAIPGGAASSSSGLQVPREAPGRALTADNARTEVPVETRSVPEHEERVHHQGPHTHDGYSPPGPNENDIVMGHLGSLVPDEDDEISFMMLEQLGVMNLTGKRS